MLIPKDAEGESSMYAGIQVEVWCLQCQYAEHLLLGREMQQSSGEEDNEMTSPEDSAATNK